MENIEQLLDKLKRNVGDVIGAQTEGTIASDEYVVKEAIEKLQKEIQGILQDNNRVLEKAQQIILEEQQTILKAIRDSRRKKETIQLGERSSYLPKGEAKTEEELKREAQAGRDRLQGLDWQIDTSEERTIRYAVEDSIFTHIKSNIVTQIQNQTGNLIDDMLLAEITTKLKPTIESIMNGYETNTQSANRVLEERVTTLIEEYGRTVLGKESKEKTPQESALLDLGTDPYDLVDEFVQSAVKAGEGQVTRGAIDEVGRTVGKGKGELDLGENPFGV